MEAYFWLMVVVMSVCNVNDISLQDKLDGIDLF